jgi:2-C-methyl-D-erythritol 2,4-cyclodiphosphate synthase
MSKPNFKIGIGYDLHRLEENRNLVIGGVKIPYEKGLLGHSDADVLVHAIIDALLGSLALPDIGTLFPDTDEKYKGANSIELLKKVYKMVKEKGFFIANLDSNIIAQAPKMMPYIPKMKEVLSSVLELEIENISIKAKTKEHLDAVGEKRAIEAQAVVMVYNV